MATTHDADEPQTATTGEDAPLLRLLPAVDEPLWTIQQLAAYLQVPVRTVRKWRESDGGPPAFVVGRHLRWRREEVMAWLEQRVA